MIYGFRFTLYWDCSIYWFLHLCCIQTINV
nr:MAG TPA: hypothetical protein [Caudoviricetes sp.]